MTTQNCDTASAFAVMVEGKTVEHGGHTYKLAYGQMSESGVYDEGGMLIETITYKLPTVVRSDGVEYTLGRWFNLRPETRFTVMPDPKLNHYVRTYAQGY